MAYGIVTVSACISGNLPSSIHPSIYPPTSTTHHISLRSAVPPMACSSLALERTNELVFPYSRIPRIPHIPHLPLLARFPFPVSHRRFSTFSAFRPRPASSSRTRYPRTRLTVFSARGRALALNPGPVPRWLPQVLHVSLRYRSQIARSPRTHGYCSASSHITIARLPLPRLRSGLQPASISSTASRLPLAASKACSPRRIYVESSSSTPPSISHLVISATRTPSDPRPLSAPHPSALTPYTHNSYRSQLRWSRPQLSISAPLTP